MLLPCHTKTWPAGQSDKLLSAVGWAHREALLGEEAGHVPLALQGGAAGPEGVPCSRFSASSTYSVRACFSSLST